MRKYVNPEPDPIPEQPTEKLFEFHYVPDEGILPGLIFEQQTEDVINDIGNYAYFAQKTASKALKTGIEASEAARTALNAAQNAQSTADRATELGNTGISKADAAQETADKALKKAETNEVSIAANTSSIATLQNTVNGQQTQLDGNLTNIRELKRQVAENKQSIDGNSKGISQCIMTIQESQRYTTTDKTDANDLTDYGRIYLPNALLHCPSGVTYPVLLDVVPSYLDDYQIDDVVVQRVIDANGVSFYRFATETTVDATTTYTFGDWKSIDTRYLKLTGGTVTGQTTFSGKLTASGETSVPTPSTENNSQTIANTEFVHGVVNKLVNGAPTALDTLQELASALGDDPNFATTILNKVGEKESKTDAQIEHEKLQNAIDLCLKGKKSMGINPETNPQIIAIPLERGIFPIQGYPDGFTVDDKKYPYSVVVNFQGESGALLSFYAQHNKRELYFRVGWPDEREWGLWTKLATTDEIPTKVSQLLNDSGYQKTAEIPIASQTQNGYMSKDDKVKLDKITENLPGVENYVKSVTESNGKVTVIKGNGESTTFNAGGLNILARNKAYAVGDIAYSPNLPSYLYLECTTAGTTGATEPDMSTLSGVVNDGTAQFSVKTVCAKEYVDSSVSNEAKKWKAAYNNLRKRSTPTAFDDDELTLLISTKTDLDSGVTLPQPYTDFDGLLIEYTGGNKTIMQREYISTAEINKMVEAIHSHPKTEPQAFFLVDGTYYWTVKASTSYNFSTTYFPNNDNNIWLWKMWGVKFKEIT